MHLKSLVILLVVALTVALGACRDALPAVPEITMPDLPALPDLPGIPTSFQEIPNLLEDLGLSDLSQLADLPQLEDLPLLNTPAGAFAFRGPTERRIDVGQRIPGTDIELISVGESEAEFRIAGLRSVRTVGDSLDFDGEWPGLSGVSYSLRLRIYTTGSSSIRAAGVQQIVIRDVRPTPGDINPNAATLNFPFTASAGVGETIAGMTFGYAGEDERGAHISGLAGDEYPYRKLGDSLRWRGLLRGDIPVDYNVRVLYYGADSVRVGGVVHVTVPGL